MDWKDVGKAVGKFAPMLGTALGGPVVGGLVSVIAGALGVEGPDPQPEQIMKAIAADPEAALKLKTVQENNRVEIERLSLQRDQAYLGDRQDARARQVAVEKVTGKKDINLYVLSYLFILGYFTTTIVVVWAVMAGRMPESFPPAAMFLMGNLIGTLSAGVGAIMQYFFGSSKSSADKTKLMTWKSK